VSETAKCKHLGGLIHVSESYAFAATSPYWECIDCGNRFIETPAVPPTPRHDGSKHFYAENFGMRVGVPAVPQAPPCEHEPQVRTIYCVKCGEEGSFLWPLQYLPPAEPAQPEIKSVRHVPGTIHGHNYGPPPVIEVAPGEPIPHDHYDGQGLCYYAHCPGTPAEPAQEAPPCGVVWEKMAELGHYECVEPKGHIGHHDDHQGSRWYEVAKAVPAQEAPREPLWPMYGDEDDPAEPQAGAQAICEGCDRTDSSQGTCSSCEPQAGAQPDATIQCIHCPHVEQWHTSGVVEGTKRGCLSCDECPGFERVGAQVPSQDESAAEWYAHQISIVNRKNAALDAHLNSIKSYATESAKTPITRESILAAPQVDDAPIPDDLKWTFNEASLRGRWDGPTVRGLVERIGRAEAALEARKLHELSQFDEMQGLCRLILSEAK
jgi:hypothetical protein